MRLKKEIESYNVKSLRGMEMGVVQMKKHCETLCALGKLLESKLEKARMDGFEDENTKRAEAVIREYVKKMSSAGMEYQELSESVKELIQKIEIIWSPWR